MRENSDTNLHRLWMRLVLCLFALSGSGTILVAQQTPDQPAPTTESQDIKPAVLVMPNYSQNIALLGTDQRYMDLGALDTKRHTFFMYGMGISESYYDNFAENAASLDGSELLWSSHVALVNASNHSSFSFQYAPTLMQTTSGASNRQVFQTGSVSFGQPIARNWLLQMSSDNTYGTDSVRLVSPLGFNVNQGVPIADPSSAVFQFNRGKVFTTADVVGLSWQRTASQSMKFSVGESYFSPLDGGGPSSRSTSTNVSYSAAVSPRTTFNVGGNYYQQTFPGSCDSYGFSFGISREVSRHINLTAEGGPEFETAPCSKTPGGNYTVTMSYVVSRRSRVGLAASRSYMTNYLANTQWSDTASVSYAKQLSESFEINLNSGYARGVRTQAGLADYVGYFAGANLSWRLTRSFSLSTEYRRFEQVSGGPALGQNVALVTLGWNPLPMRIVK